MPEYLSPGVYVEEVSSGAKPIEGVSTSTAGFVGQTERGPEYPLLVTSWTDFQRHYGSYLSTDVSYLPHAVQGFFDNGGKRLYVARVVPGVAKAAGTIAPTRGQATLGDLTIQAVGRGDWANRVYYTIEKASKARTAADDSPVKGWIKLTLLYYSRAPKSKAFKAFDTVQQAGNLVAAIDTAADKAAQDASDAATAVTNFEGDGSDANAQAARAAVDLSKTSSADLVQLIGDIATAVKDAQTEAAAALAASPDDAALKDAKDAADAALAAISTAETRADAAAEAAGDCAAEDPPTSAMAGPAATAAGDAKTEWSTAKSELTKMTEKATAAYPSQAAQVLAAQAVSDAAAAKEAAEDAKQPIADSLAAPADAELKEAAQTAATSAKDAAEMFSKTATALKDVVDTISTSAVDLQPVKDAVNKLAEDAALAFDAATACATEPFETAKSDAAITAASMASNDAATAAPLVDSAANLVQASAPVRLAVNPMIQENQLNRDFRAPDTVEVYDNLRLAAGASNSLVVTVNGASQLVVLDLGGPNVPLSGTEPGDVDPPIPIFTALSGGAAGTDSAGNPLTLPTLADFKGTPDPVDNNATLFGTGTGLAGLAAVEDISLLAAPDEVLVDGLSQEVINQCELLRDRFGIVSSKNGQANITNINPIQDTTYAAFYYPWIWIFDPASNGPLLVPPTGHVTGLIARVDIDRGVHKAPANEVLRNATGLEFPIPTGKQDILNPRGVNCVRDFRPQGRSIRLWGARTMTSDPEWKYINVRRLFIFVEQSILRGTNWVVFEPNDEFLWIKVRLVIGSFLTAVWKDGALMGTTADEAFFVRCDRTTMTQNDLDNGRLICLIGIAPVKPAEFVIFRISQKMQDATE